VLPAFVSSTQALFSAVHRVDWKYIAVDVFSQLPPGPRRRPLRLTSVFACWLTTCRRTRRWSRKPAATGGRRCCGTPRSGSAFVVLARVRDRGRKIRRNSSDVWSSNPGIWAPQTQRARRRFPVLQCEPAVLDQRIGTRHLALPPLELTNIPTSHRDDGPSERTSVRW
jgi:hypothetical protein